MDTEALPEDDAALAATFDGRRWRFPWLEVCAGIIYTIALIAYTAHYGAPLKTVKIFIAIMLGLLVPTLRRPRHWLKGVVRDWVPLLVILSAYDYLRGRADNINSVVHYDPQLAMDKLLSGGQTLSHVLQDVLWKGTASWYDHIVSTIYLSHFCVTMIVLAVLWLTNEQTFRRYRNLVLVVVLAAFATYFAYPAAPPWLASYTDRTPEVVRTVGLTLHAAALQARPPVLPGQGNALSNPVAALPSLHAALPLLLALFFWKRVRRPVRILLAAYPPAMAFVLIYGGEHFVFDILMGWAYAVIAFVVLSRLWRRIDSRDALDSELTDEAAIAAAPPSAPSSTPA
jgi:membrane-associated phospholipid phosphatase